MTELRDRRLARSISGQCCSSQMPQRVMEVCAAARHQDMAGAYRRFGMPRLPALQHPRAGRLRRSAHVTLPCRCSSNSRRSSSQQQQAWSSSQTPAGRMGRTVVDGGTPAMERPCADTEKSRWGRMRGRQPQVTAAAAATAAAWPEWQQALRGGGGARMSAKTGRQRFTGWKGGPRRSRRGSRRRRTQQLQDGPCKMGEDPAYLLGPVQASLCIRGLQAARRGVRKCCRGRLCKGRQLQKSVSC